MENRPIHESNPGNDYDMQIILPYGSVVQKPIQAVDIDGDDLTVKQSKAKLIEELLLGDIDPNTVSLVLKKGNDEIVMNNDAKTVDYKASTGNEQEVYILTPYGGVVLKQIPIVDIDGDDLTVNQSKTQLIEDFLLGNIDPNTVSLVLKKGNDEIVMNNDAKTVDYVHYITDQYLLEIKINQ